ncbi:MAG TPA: radical SAM protein [Thermodesulfovibrionales bacterium]|nr:radical SAM protein [Thermodesulfovibrionales bacterium]
MGIVIREIQAKSVLSRSGIPGADYCINAYVGCAHACVYCYATFMKKYTGHTEPWGKFVDIKINAPELLGKQLKRAAGGNVMLSSVTDAYQPLEEKYRLTRQCLRILADAHFPVDILTKSPLVLRDLDLIRRFRDIDVGVTVTTDDEGMRRVFEPHAPSIIARIEALRTLKERGVRTYVFIGPMLPMDPEKLAAVIRDTADRVLISRMNYLSRSAHVFRRLSLSQWLDPGFADDMKARLKLALGKKEITEC